MTSSYTSRSACRGKRPAAFLSESGFSRTHLLARLLKERTVARFLVAPCGYGKTLLAFEYAETIFDWEHVFWFNAQSPCFIRDLDAQVLALSCLEFDDQAALAVFDDIPFLDVTRAEIFSKQIDMLLQAGCEIIVSTRPACNLAKSFQHDRISLGPTDLLLSDEELEEHFVREEKRGQRMQDVPAAKRVPALVWGSRDGDAGMTSFKKNVLSEEAPQDVYNVMASILILQQDTIETVQAHVPVDTGLLAALRAEYPHLGISEDLDSFDAISLEIDVLASQIKSRLETMVEWTEGGSRIGLIEGWAQALINAGRASRACELVHALASRQEAAAWLISQRRELIRQASFHKMLLIARNTTGLDSVAKAQLSVLEALCCQVLDDTKTAVLRARRIAKNKSLPNEERACAYLILLKLAARDYYPQAVSFLQEIAAFPTGGTETSGANEDWRLLVWMKLSGLENARALGKAWEELRYQQVSADILCIGASWVFTQFAQQLQHDPDEAFFPELACIQNYVHAQLEDPDNTLDFYAISAGLSMEYAHECGMTYSSGTMSAAILFGMRQFELMLLSQRNCYARERRDEEVRRSQWSQVHPDGVLVHASTTEAKAVQRIPLLSLRLFGTLEVSIGDTPLDDVGALKNHNARTLLAILAVNQGREVSREALAQALWPDSSRDVANKNFYTIWSRLRQTLSIADGTCPYLIRHQYGCSLAQRYIASDVDRFNEICRKLLFGIAEHNEWPGLFNEIDRDYSSELLPGEMRNQMIISARREFRDKLVDALVSASVENLDAGDPKWGICFAREALRRDETREDAYIALMRSQIASLQRTSAIMTYFRCQKTLGEQLGIDPSPETSQLYQELIVGDLEKTEQRNDSIAKP